MTTEHEHAPASFRNPTAAAGSTAVHRKEQAQSGTSGGSHCANGRLRGNSLGLTERQRRVLDYINAYQQLSGGLSPSFSEIAGGAGLHGKWNVHQVIVALEQHGVICRLRGRARAIEIVDPRPVTVPMLNGQPLQLVPINHGSGRTYA